MSFCTKIPKAEIPAVPRIIVLGDIHGDWKALKSSLKLAGVSNHYNEWVGGSTHVVQVGDIVDRKNRSSSNQDEKSEKKILNHLLDLQKQARRAGGGVHLLLGNHELMNVAGDFRYVSPLGLTDFGGLEGRRKAFQPGGTVATALACNAVAVLKIGSWIFSHAGITKEISNRYSLRKVNRMVREYLLGNSTMNPDHPVMDIFWHRRYSAATPAACTQFADSVSAWNGKYMAIGHTVQQHGINGVCDDRLWKVDAGMSKAFKISSTSAVEVLEIMDDGDRVNVLRL